MTFGPAARPHPRAVASSRPLRRWRVLVWADVAGYVVISVVIVVLGTRSRIEAGATDPSGRTGLSSSLATFAFGLPLVPVAVTAVLAQLDRITADLLFTYYGIG